MRTIHYGLISRIKSFGNSSVPEISIINLCEVLKIITFSDILSVQKKNPNKTTQNKQIKTLWKHIIVLGKIFQIF